MAKSEFVGNPKHGTNEKQGIRSANSASSNPRFGWGAKYKGLEDMGEFVGQVVETDALKVRRKPQRMLS